MSKLQLYCKPVCPVCNNMVDTGDAWYRGAEAFAITLNINAVCLSPSDQVLNPLLVAAHQDGRAQLNISGSELTVSTSTGCVTSKTVDIKHVLGISWNFPNSNLCYLDK